ncbi:MAG: hypothetical protein EOP04_13090 [Proteobacteria bacterium]|nr:MAG: hypothetical protein EOP04_13090 [Pseudomonadota bacterium]
MRMISSIIIIFLFFGWPMVLLATIFYWKRLKKKAPWLVALSLLMPILGLFIYGAIHGDSIETAKVAERKIMAFREQQIAKDYCEGELEPIPRIHNFEHIYRGKLVKIMGYLSREPEGLTIAETECSGLFCQRLIVVKDNSTVGGDQLGLVQTIGRMDVVIPRHVNAETITRIAVADPLMCR